MGNDCFCNDTAELLRPRSCVLLWTSCSAPNAQEDKCKPVLGMDHDRSSSSGSGDEYFGTTKQMLDEEYTVTTDGSVQRDLESDVATELPDNFDKLSLYNYIFEDNADQFPEKSPLLLALKKPPSPPLESEPDGERIGARKGRSGSRKAPAFPPGSSSLGVSTPREEQKETGRRCLSLFIGTVVIAIVVLSASILFASDSSSSLDHLGDVTHYAVIIRVEQVAELFVYSFTNISNILYLHGSHRTPISMKWNRSMDPAIFKPALLEAREVIPEEMRKLTPLKLYAKPMPDADWIRSAEEFFLTLDFSLSEIPIIESFESADGTLSWISLTSHLRKNIFGTDNVALLYGDDSMRTHAVSIDQECAGDNYLESFHGELCFLVESDSFDWIHSLGGSRWIESCVHATSELHRVNLTIEREPNRRPSLQACELALLYAAEKACESFGSIPKHVELLYVVSKVFSSHGITARDGMEVQHFLDRIRRKGAKVCKKEAKPGGELDCAYLAHTNDVIECLQIRHGIKIAVPGEFEGGHEVDSMHGAAIRAIFQLRPDGS